MDTGNKPYTFAQHMANEAGWLKYGAAMACVRELIPELVGPTVLDVGGGTGVMAAIVRVLRPEWRVIVADQSRDALRRAAKRGIDGVYCTPEAIAIPAGAKSYDSVYTSHVLEHLTADECRVMLAECFRVAKSRVIHIVPVGDVEDRNSGTPHLRQFDEDTFWEIFVDVPKPTGWKHWSQMVISDERMHSIMSRWECRV